MIPLDCDPLTKIEEDTFGTVTVPHTSERKLIRRYTLKNSKGLKVKVINYGALVNFISVPDKYNIYKDVVLGFHDVNGYVNNKKYRLAGIIGRVTGRIKQGKIRINEQEFQLTKNDNGHHLHGGNKSFDQVIWDSCSYKSRVNFGYYSMSGEEGYPGNVIANVSYGLTEDNGLLVNMTAFASDPTCINLSNNIAFNLAGHEAGPTELLQHYVTLQASHYFNKEKNRLRQVFGLTDLRIAKKLGNTIYKVRGGGYDHTMTVFRQYDDMNFVGRVYHPPSGRAVEVFSDQTAVHLYNHRWLPDKDAGDMPLIGKYGTSYQKYGGLSLLTSNYYDMEKGEYPILLPGQVYNHTVLYRFAVFPPY